MASPFIVTLLALALQMLVCTPALAHDFWIEPSTFHPTPGAALTLRLRVGERFIGDPVPRDASLIQRFTAVGPGADARILGRDGSDPAGVVALGAPGLWVVGYSSRPTPIEIEAGKFESYLAAEGLDDISALRAARGESGAPGRERFSRCAKSLLLAGNAPLADQRLTVPLGFTLEIMAEKNPYALAPNAQLPVRILFDGAPSAGLLVTALNQGHPEASVAARTGQDGRVSLPLTSSGVWLVKAVHMERTPPGSTEQYESYWASLTFRVGGE